MGRLLVQRFSLALVVLALVSLIVFVMVELLPGDAATAYLGRNATPEGLERVRITLGLDRPAPERFLRWAGGMLRGDLGVSLARQEPINSFLWLRLRNSLLLGITAALVGFPLAIGLGIIAGLTRDRLPDLLLSTVSLIGMSLPEFVTATLLIYLFSIQWRIFPAVTLVNPDAPLLEMLPNIVLPILTLIILLTAYILRVVRTSIIEVMRSDYIRTARSKGMASLGVIVRHALPNALLPTLTIAALTIAWLIGGLFVIETVFNYPGVGTLLLTAIHDRDLPLVQSIAVVMAVIYVLANLLADLLTLLFNPRLRSAQAGRQ
ncbi:MAG TPA: ABC transporter permease [Caldilineaceae bacterium]|nr:ABC transporter permease [Caldilineaceae bacterium]